MGFFQKEKGQTIIEPAGNVNIPDLMAAFSDCGDLVTRRLYPGGNREIRADIFFLDGLVSGITVSENIIRPFSFDRRLGAETDERRILELMAGGLIYGISAKIRLELEDVVTDMLNGFCVIVFQKTGGAVTFETRDLDKRSVTEPKEEKVVKGAKDAFIEVLRVNTAMIRKKLRNEKLKLRQLAVGSESNTQVAVLYMEGLAKAEIVDEVYRRLENLQVDGVLSAAVLEEALEDDYKSPFPQLISTERSDKFCLNLLEGRVGVIADGLPLGYLAPGTFSQFFKVPEDNAEHFSVASILTVLRYLSMFITLFLPAFYLAVALYHQEMLPTKLLQSMIDAKQSVPFPTAVEVIMMLLAFELLQEAGLRLPNPVGQTVSIIGALIVGQSAVEAKVVSPVVVVVIALAGIAGYTMPNQDMSAALRITRFLLVLAALFGGMFGLAMGAALLLYHLCSLESYGVPYITPFSESRLSYVLRGFLRFPLKGRSMQEPAVTGQKEQETKR